MSIQKMFFSMLIITGFAGILSQEVTTDYPTLPSMWVAETIEPGAPGGGKGIESYMFVETPSDDKPSAMWSNYTGCQRLIYVPHTSNAKRYLLGCDAVNCCWEEQNGNQVQFQIPNVHYSNPTKKVDVYWRNANVTNFGKTIEADEWSWSWTVKDKLSQDWRAYTLPCEMCVNGIELIQWQSRAMGSEWFSVQFKNYHGIDPNTDEGERFKDSFSIPQICQKNNLLKCPSGLHDKYFENNMCCSSCPTGTEKYYSIPLFPKNRCGESCIDPKDYNKYHVFEPQLTKADTNTPCLDKGYTYYTTEQHGFGPVKIGVDLYKMDQIEINSSITPVDTLDLNMYYGRWYQVYEDKFDMAFQGKGTCAVADYGLNNNNISVLNSQINTNGKVSQIKGYAFYQNDDIGGKLTVMLDGVSKPSPYWVIELGPVIDNQYQYSIISDDKQLSLFVLTRNVQLFYDKYSDIVTQSLTNMGFIKYINKPIVMPQENCDYSKFDKYTVSSPDCGTCGTAYQTCCIGFAIDGYPCDCHLQEGGSGTSGSNCGDCGTAYSACCIGYAADGYPCQCDVA